MAASRLARLDLPSAESESLADGPRTEHANMVAHHAPHTAPRLRRDLNAAQECPVKLPKHLQQTGLRHRAPLPNVGLRTQPPKRVLHLAGRPLDLVRNPLTHDMIARVVAARRYLSRQRGQGRQDR